MNISRFFLVALLFLGFTASASAADERSAELFAAANEAYQQEDFSQAAELYEQYLRLHGPSEDVFYNLGNAWFRLNEPGKALLNYERARILDPRDDDVEFNREFLIRQAGAALPEPGRFGFLMRNVTLNEAVLATALLGWITVFLFVISAVRAIRRRRLALLWLVAGLTMLMLAILGLLTADYLINSRYHPGFAVVTPTEGAPALAQPALSAEPLRQLPSGSQVIILATRGKWHYVLMPGQEQGWMSVNDAERVVPESLRSGG